MLSLAKHYITHSSMLMVRLTHLVLLLSCVQPAVAATSHDGATTRAPLGSEAQEKVIASIDEVVAKAMEDPGAVGLSLAVAVGGELLYSNGYGMAELEHDVAADKDTMFRIGSITKQYTAAAIVRLAEQDKLYIDDPLERFVPEFNTRGQEITIRNLLTHTSGIFNYTNLGPSWFQYIALDREHDEMLSLVAEKPLDFTPGSAYSYSNTGYYLLGMIVEEASGMDFPSYLEAELLSPPGLDRTTYDSNRSLMRNRAQGYVRLPSGGFANDDMMSPTQPYAAGAMLATGEDLVHWTLALNSGQVVSVESYEEMTLPFLLDDGRESLYGFGLDLHDIEGQPCISHGGGVSGFNSMMMHFPETGLTVAVISNCEGFSARTVASKLVRLLQAK